MLIGCGSSSSPAAEATGPHTTYAVDHIYLPTNNTEARAYALDLNGDRTLDNQLGMVLGTLASMGIDSENATAGAVQSGAISLVADLQTPSFTDARAAGFTIAPAADAQIDAPLVGRVTNGVFALGPGEVSIMFAFVDPSVVITLPLEYARVEIDAADDTAISSGIVVGGLGPQALDTAFLPAARQGLSLIVARDCGKQNANVCGCLQGSMGKEIIEQFDVAPADCAISLPEVINNDLTKSLLAPDLAFGGTQYVSAGFAFTAVATPPPN
jgi:hypothetical protein